MKMLIKQKQALKMIMTPELNMAIQLLQFSTYELMQFIQKQSEENPFIELNESHYSNRSSYKSTQQEIDILDFATNNHKSLHEHLLEQVRWMNISNTQYQIAHYLILNINDQGYLTLTDEEIAEHLNMNVLDVNSVKKILHELKPLGIGGANLSECLLIQAYEYYPKDTLLHQVVEEHLPSLADKQWEKIAKQYNITLFEVNEAFHKIQTLNPRPAVNFGKDIDYAIPDIIIDYNKNNGRYQVQLNDHYIPKLHFNRNYSDQLQQSQDISPYINEHYKKFEWLQRSIMQRRATILKIMEVVIRYQEDFLNKGIRFLKPLTLKDVATKIDMHESTVSRATTNKIIETPAGTFQLRNLFSTKLSSSSGNNQSQTSVKELIRDLIQKEDKYKPLSDQKIVVELEQSFDIEISRRTVAKYRFELQIPSSSKRKEIKVV